MGGRIGAGMLASSISMDSVVAIIGKLLRVDADLPSLMFDFSFLLLLGSVIVKDTCTVVETAK